MEQRALDRTPSDASPRRMLRRDEEALALTYGVEARRHYGDRAWSEVEPELASGWSRLRKRSRTEWADVADRVEAAWSCALPPGER
ncbi:hypothetical protein [Lysobacter sp. D1-1-M9]|uniref:hypothetical protein n=1 Tax=Novilysobacter longmucuonensis TaxID=3098603 RepID=UPI002FCBA71D